MANNYNSSPVFLGGQFAPFFSGQYSRFFQVHKEVIIKQYPLLTRILNFSYKYELTHQVHLPSTYYQITAYMDPLTEKVIKYDTTLIEAADTFHSTIPAFIAHKEKRKEFEEDIKFLKENKNSIDHLIFKEVQDLLDILIEYPLPNQEDQNKHKSEWATEHLQNRWHKEIDDLYRIVLKNLY